MLKIIVGPRGCTSIYVASPAGIRLTGAPEEIPTSQANRGPGPSPKQEVPPLALPFQEHQRQEALADCAWRLQLARVPERSGALCSWARPSRSLEALFVQEVEGRCHYRA